MDRRIRRYCPSCAVARASNDARVGDAYTCWEPMGFGPSEGARFTGRCEHDDQDHSTYLYKGKYVFDWVNNRCCCAIVCPDDNGVRCCSATGAGHDLWGLLVAAMEKEADDGVLEVMNWLFTFPRRTIELVRRSRRMAAEALADELPVVLVGIVCDYFMEDYLAN